MKKLAALAPFILIIIIYLSLLLIINRNIFQKTDAPYYNFLAESFLKKKLNIIPESLWDLSLYQNKFYLYWGPAPLLLILPVVYLFGRNFSDILYTFSIGLLNIFIFYAILHEVIKFFKIHLQRRSKTILLWCFALSSPNLFLSLHGKIWYTNQIFAVFYLLVFLFFYFRFLNTGKIRHLLLSCIFVNLAWFSRYTLIFYLGLFAFPIFLNKIYKNKEVVFTMVIAVTSVFLSVFFLYNFFRFGHILETGFRFQLANPIFVEDIRKGAFLSLGNIPINFYYYFINPFQLSLTKNFFQIDYAGNSVFMAYPILFSLYYLTKLKPTAVSSQLIKIILTIAVIIIVILLTNVGSGWIQFGNRYFFDVIPLFFVLIIFSLTKTPVRIQIFLAISGAIINILGVLNFYNII